MLKRTGPLRFFSRLPPRFILRRQGPRYTAIFAFWGNFGLDGSCRQILIPRSLRNSALLAPPGSTLALGTCPKESRGAPRRTYIVGLHIYIYKCIGASGVHALKLLEEVFGVSWECLGAPRGLEPGPRPGDLKTFIHGDSCLALLALPRSPGRPFDMDSTLPWQLDRGGCESSPSGPIAGGAPTVHHCPSFGLPGCVLLGPPSCCWFLLALPGSSWLFLAPLGLNSFWLLLVPPGSLGASWLTWAPLVEEGRKS